MASAPPATPPGNPPPATGPLAPSELYRNYNFLLTVDAAEFRFSECIGLGMRREPIRDPHGGQGDTVPMFAGALSYSEIICRYGVTDSLDLWTWVMSTASGNVQRKLVSIVQLGNDGLAPKITWHLHGAWVCQWSGVPFDSLGRDIAIEEVRLAFNRLERA